jgi:hypothetical protein
LFPRDRSLLKRERKRQGFQPRVQLDHVVIGYLLGGSGHIMALS